jgi:hypothetical protein
LLLAASCVVLSGCATIPANPLRTGHAQREVMTKVMACDNQVVLLSSPEFRHGKPVLLLLHGATDDPTEMMSIASEWLETHNVLLYSYNFRHSLERIGSGLVLGMKALKPAGEGASITVVTYSYSAIIFRKTMLLPDAKVVFGDASLIQLVPTAGGSFLARSLWNRVAISLVALASKASAAESPYGAIAEELWNDEGHRRFCEIIRPERVHTLLLEMDSHSLAGVPDEDVQKRYRNGIGLHAMIIPKSLGVTHDNFPNHPIVLAHLRRILEQTLRERTRSSEPRAVPQRLSQAEGQGGGQGGGADETIRSASNNRRIPSAASGALIPLTDDRQDPGGEPGPSFRRR